MGIGNKIKEYRTKSGLTQKDLAEQLNVTFQAVSRWENNDVEPSFDTVKEMCKIFNCSADDLLDTKKEEPVVENNKPEEKVQVVEKVVVEQAKPILVICADCNKAIYESKDIFKFEEAYSVHTGRTSHREYREKTLCKKCYDRRIEKQKEEAETKERVRIYEIEKRRTHSFIWPTIVAVILLICSIVSFVQGNINSGIEFLVFAVLSYTFLGSMILNNTFITEMWEEVASWGFVKLPGIIFEFSIDGFIKMLIAKAILFFLGFLLAIASFAFATLLAMALSIFVYPFALRKNLKEIE